MQKLLIIINNIYMHKMDDEKAAVIDSPVATAILDCDEVNSHSDEKPSAVVETGSGQSDSTLNDSNDTGISARTHWLFSPLIRPKKRRKRNKTQPIRKRRKKETTNKVDKETSSSLEEMTSDIEVEVVDFATQPDEQPSLSSVGDVTEVKLSSDCSDRLEAIIPITHTNPNTDSVSDTANSTSCDMPKNQEAVTMANDDYDFGISETQRQKLLALDRKNASTTTMLSEDEDLENSETIDDKLVSYKSLNRGVESGCVNNKAKPIRNDEQGMEQLTDITNGLKSTGESTPSDKGAESDVLFDSQGGMESESDIKEAGSKGNGKEEGQVITNERVESEGKMTANKQANASNLGVVCDIARSNVAPGSAEVSGNLTPSKTNRRKERPRLELAAPLDDAQWHKLWDKPKQSHPLRSYQTIFQLQPRYIKSHSKNTNSGENPVRHKPPRVLCYRLEKDMFFMTSIRLGECFDEIQYELYSSPKLSFEKDDSSPPKVTIDSCSSEDEEIERVEFEKGVDEVDRMFIEAAEANSKNANQGRAGIDQLSCDDHVTSQAKGLTTTDEEIPMESGPSTCDVTSHQQANCSDKACYRPIITGPAVLNDCDIELEESKGKLSLNEKLGISPVKVRTNTAGGQVEGTKTRVFKKVAFVCNPTATMPISRNNTCIRLRTTGTQTKPLATSSNLRISCTQTVYHLKSKQTQTTETPLTLTNHTTSSSDTMSTHTASTDPLPQTFVQFSKESHRQFRPNGTLFSKYLQKQKAIRNRTTFELDSQQRATIREDFFGSDTMTDDISDTVTNNISTRPQVPLQRIITSDYTIPSDIASLIERYWFTMHYR